MLECVYMFAGRRKASDRVRSLSIISQGTRRILVAHVLVCSSDFEMVPYAFANMSCVYVFLYVFSGCRKASTRSMTVESQGAVQTLNRHKHIHTRIHFQCMRLA